MTTYWKVRQLKLLDTCIANTKAELSEASGMRKSVLEKELLDFQRDKEDLIA